ncbi:MAG: hypothetical protein H0U98_02440 [Alphaproteobacteria bacterium]|nr:hypothetical protein [Alphaproteobacteria bacterium]
MKLLKRLLHTIRLYYFNSPDEKDLIQAYARRQPASRTPADAPAIAVQCSADILYFGVFGEIVTALREHFPLHADQYVFRSLRVGESHFPIGFLWTALVENGWSDRRWQRLYAAYCDRVAVRSAAWLSPLAELRIWRQASRLWRQARDKNDFASLTVDGILIGDLIIDAYVRFKPSPEFDLRDRYVLRILRQALRDIKKARAYFGMRRPKLFLTSYTSYIQHGIPARVAVALGIQTVSFGSYQQMCKPLSQEDQTHLAEHWHYHERFKALPVTEQRARRASADERLNSRMRGEIDNAIGYMRTSAYAAHSTEIPDVKGTVIIYLPDFYDSIHVYRWTAFHDYWEWACFTIDTLSSAGIPFLIKAHPNASPDSKLVYDRLCARYPALPFVPPGVTTAQLAEAGIAAGVSPRGTVLSELAFLGVPVIAAGDHPHAEFDLVLPPRTVADYRSRLLNATQLPRDPQRMRDQACEFYAMHNLLPDPDEVALRDKWLAVRATTMTEDTVSQYTVAKVIASLADLGEAPAFRKYIAEWANHIAPGQGHLSRRDELGQGSSLSATV